ncbi:MAG: hypothetical protein R2851_01810 [Caldilineaceae bacterium]
MPLRFVGEEGYAVVGHGHHVAAVVKDHDARCAQERALAPDARFVQRDLQVVAREEAPESPAMVTAWMVRPGAGPPAQS